MQLLMDGLLLLLVGMATVIGFLLLVIGWIQLSSELIRRFSHLFPALQESGSEDKSTQAAEQRTRGDDQAEHHRMVAAISAALRHYRRHR